MAAQYEKVLGAHPVFTSRPNIAAALAQANPDRETLQIVGGFLSSLHLAKQVRLARAGSAKLSLSDRDRAYLQVIGERFDDVDAEPLFQAAATQRQAAISSSHSAVADVPHAGGFIGKLASAARIGSSFVAHAADVPVLGLPLKGLTMAADAAKGPVRVLEQTPFNLPGAVSYGADVLQGNRSVTDLFGTKDMSEVKRGMQERGYDTSNPISVYQFFAKGENNYHSLDDLRKQFGEGSVRTAQEYLENPAGFDVSPDLTDEQNISRIQAVNDPRFHDLVTRVDSRHMSAGRDIANAVGVDPGTKPFKLLSGSIDAVESWFVDPTVVGGAALKAQKLSKLGVHSLTDEAGIRRVMANNANVKRGWQSLLDRSKVIRSTDATDAEKAAAFAGIRAETPGLLPLVDEINGKVPTVVHDTQKLSQGVKGPERLIQSRIEIHSAPAIETLDSLTEYLVAKNALVRVTKGAAPKLGVYMPGSVSKFAAGKARLYEKAALRSATRLQDRVIDLSKDAAKVIPTEEDAVGGLLATAAARGDELAKVRSGARGRFLAAAKRVSTLMPVTSKIDYYDPKASEQVFKWAQIYMPKSEARMVAAKFAGGDLADRRLVYKSMMEQSIHASGMESSASGREMAKRMRGDLDSADTQKFSMADGADTIADEAGTRRVGVFPGQLDTEMWLPAFKEMQKHAAKVSLYDHSLRRVADNSIVEGLMHTLRSGWLITTAGFMRNVLDNLAGAAASGMGWATFKAKLTINQRKAARALEREVVNPGDNASFASELAYHKARVGRVYNRLKTTALKPHKDQEFSDAADLMASELAEGHMARLGAAPAAMVTGVADPHNLEQVAEIARMGARPSEVSFKQWTSTWGEVAADGEVGARAWAHNLDQVVSEHPVLAQRLVEAVRGQQGTTKGVESVVNDNRLERLALHIADHPEMAKYREFAELARPLKHADTNEIKMEAARSIADRMTRSFEALVTDRSGQPIHKLLDRLESGQVPSLDWFHDHIPMATRPDKVIGKQWAAVAANPAKGGIAGIGQTAGQGYTNLLAKGYDVVVSGPIARLSSHPIYLGNLVKARRNLAGYTESLVKQGMDEGAAKMHADKLALDHALDMTSRMIDNPEVASQMATISRNLVNFPRAAEDWVRRWGRIIKEDPSRVRKIQMAFEGGQHSGIVDRDDQGNLIFTYPGSGAAINAVLKVGEILRIPHVASIPTVPDLQSNLLFINPSFDNPFFPGASPLIVTPLKVAQAFMPESSLLMQDITATLTGSERGASQGVLEQFVPSVVRNMFKALTADEMDASLSSAAMNAIVHLDAAGLTPPPNATPDERDAFLQRVRTAAKNQLVMRAIFAFALPASPALPENDVAGTGNPDALFAAQGLSSLKDEARVLVAKLGFERAMAVWTKLHPDELAYMVGRTESGSPYGSVSPTRGAQEWIDSNLSFVQKYKSIAAYFVPDAPGNFSPEAYRAQLELDLRSRKTLGKFYSDVRIINAEREYYTAKDARDKAIAEAHAAGDTERVKQIRTGWSAWTQGDDTQPGFLNVNPLFAEKLSSYGERTVWRQQAVGELEKMAQAGEFGDVAGRAKGDTIALDTTGRLPIDATTAEGVSALLQAYRAHNAYTDKMRGTRDSASLAAKDNEQRAYDKHMLSITGASYDANGRLTGGSSALRDLYQGLFRGLD